MQWVEDNKYLDKIFNDDSIVFTGSSTGYLLSLTDYILILLQKQEMNHFRSTYYRKMSNRLVGSDLIPITLHLCAIHWVLLTCLLHEREKERERERERVWVDTYLSFQRYS